MTTQYVPDPRCKAAELDPAQFVTRFVDEQRDADGQPTLAYYREEWWRFDRGRYRQCSKAEMKSLILEALNQRAHHATTAVTRNIREQLEAAVLVPDAGQTPCWLGEETESRPDPRECLAMPNGILHIPSGDFLPPTASLFATAGPDYDYVPVDREDPDATYPARWLRFLGELWSDEPASILLLQEYAGYCLTADTWLQKALMMIGPPRAGKGVICHVLSHLIGAGNTVSPTFASLAGNFGLAALQHATLAVITDARISGRVDVSVAVERLLAVIGGDSVNVGHATESDNGELRIQLTVENQGRVPLRDVRFTLNPPLTAILPAEISFFESGKVVELEFKGHNRSYSDDQISATRWSNSEWSLNWTARNLAGASIDNKCELGVEFQRDERRDQLEQAVAGNLQHTR